VFCSAPRVIECGERAYGLDWVAAVVAVDG
jgi:hypothetical protein